MNIFFFYTSQHWKYNMSFDDLLIKKSLLDFGEFNIFCKDFKVPLSKTRLQRVFKKSSINHRPHEFDEFQKSIDLLALEAFQFKIDQMKKRIDEI